jgi:selenocysteine lyase/cysteine desulfurase
MYKGAQMARKTFHLFRTMEEVDRFFKLLENKEQVRVFK